jgi:hypothetical protein
MEKIIVKNRPYVKSYNDGVLTNPIAGSYKSPHPNRRQRRQSLKNGFMNNGSDTNMVVVGIGKGVFLKYIKYRQFILDKVSGLVKIIKHTELKK